MSNWRFAELSVGESLQSPDTCDHCGRTELKKTIKVTHRETGGVAWLGTGCAAKAVGVGLDEAKRARVSQEDARTANARAERARAHREEDASWQKFLDERAGIINAWDGRRDRFAQIEKLGGFSAARAAWKAARA